MHVNIKVLITLIPLPYLSPLILIPLLLLLSILLLRVISILLLVLLLLLLSAVLLLHPVAPELLSCVYAVLLIACSTAAITLVAPLVLAAILLVALLLSTILLAALLSSVALVISVSVAGVYAHLSTRARHDIFVGLPVAASHCVFGMRIVLMSHQGAVACLAFVPLWVVVAICVAIVVVFKPVFKV